MGRTLFFSGEPPRRLTPADRDAFRDHLLGLDEAARRSRFGMKVADAFLIDYAERSFSGDAVLFGVFDGADLCAVAELRPVGPDPRQAEAAFSVEPSRRGRGLGTALMQRVILAARNKGIRRLFMTCLAQNRAMQALARKFDAELTFEPEDVSGILEAAEPTSASLMDEALVEARGFATAMLRLQTAWIPRFPFLSAEVFSGRS